MKEKNKKRKSNKDKVILSLILISLLSIFIVFLIICSHIDNYQVKGSISKIEKNNEVDETNATFITMSDDNNYVYIDSAGTYVLSGTCNDGYILVDAKKQNIYLVLDNLTLTSLSTSCIIIDDASQVFLNIKKNTVNTLSDSSGNTTYTVKSGTVKESTGCIYSTDNLTINGLGTLNVYGNNNNGIVCNDSLTIYSSTINVNSVNHGIKVHDALVIDEAIIVIKSSKDGIHAVNSNNPNKNYCTILGGTLNITSTSDGIDASGNLAICDGNIEINASNCGLKSETDVIIKGGNININSANHAIKGSDVALLGGDATLQTTSATSCVKSSNRTYINGSTINITSIGDGFNSDNSFRLKDGNITVYAEDDGITCDASLVINGGTLNITLSYEGLESPYITITGGNISIVASDDGVNINCTPHDGMGGANNSSSYSSSSGLLKITGGYLYVLANGDGLDSNDSIKITGGVIVVSGPTNNANAALDFDSSCKISGNAVLICAGSSGMAQAPTTGSRSVSATFSKTYTADTTILITDSSGNFVIAYTAEKSFSHIVINTPKLKYGKSYTMYVSSSVSGDDFNGLYLSGTIDSTGTAFETFTMNSSSVTIGSTSNQMGGGMRR